MRLRRTSILAAAWAIALPGTAAADPHAPLAQAEARERSRCEAIPRDRGSTAMLFNPANLQTVYDRSQCFQDLAVRLGDVSLCELAVERRSAVDAAGGPPQHLRLAAELRLEPRDLDERRALRQLAPGQRSVAGATCRVDKATLHCTAD